MGTRKNHHIVSQGFQRLFARDERVIRLIDKETKIARLVGTRNAFARTHFNSFLLDGEWSDEIEDGWARIENDTLPCARRLNRGARDAETREALKPLAALHYIRNEAFEITLDRLTQEQRAEAPERIASLVDAQEAFEREFHRPPRSGELEGLVSARLDEMVTSRQLFVHEMARSFLRSLELLAPHHVQLVWPSNQTVDFVFGDVPLVTTGKDGRISAREGLALGDAVQVFFPIGPRLAALFTSSPFDDAALTVDQVQLLNGRTWKAAIRFLGAHPDTDVRRSLLKWDLVIEN